MQGATVTPGNGYETPSKLMKNNTDTNNEIPSHSGTPVIPVVRSALDIVADLYVLVPEIKSYVQHMVTSDSFLFFKSYILSVDPKTVISATNFVSNIISDFSTPSENGISIVEIEKKLDLNDIKSFYNCVTERLLLYCELNESKVQSITSDICNEMKSSGTVNTTSKQSFTENDFENKNGLNQRINVIAINDSRINEPASNQKPFTEFMSKSEKAKSIVFMPLIRSLSTLINKCLITADALPLNELSNFYSFKYLMKDSEDHTLNNDAEVLMLSLQVAFLDLLMISSGNSGSESKITNCELYKNANDRNLINADIRNINIDENVSNDNNGDGRKSLNIEEKDEIFNGFMWRKRQLILTILSSIFLLRSHAILLINSDMKESKHKHSSSSNPNAVWLDNFDTTITTFFQSRIQTTIRPSILIQNVFFSVLKQGGINENEFLDSIGTNEDDNRDIHATESTTCKEKRRLFSISRMFLKNMKNVRHSEQNINVDDINDNADDDNNINMNNINYYKMEFSDSNLEQMKVKRNKVSRITNDDIKSNDNHNNYDNNILISINKNSIDFSKSDCYGDGDGQGSDESQGSCLLTLTCLGPSPTTSNAKINDINTNTNNADNSTCENKLKCRANFSSPEKNILQCPSDQNQIGNDNWNENKNQNENKSKNKDETYEYANLSTAFTPAHSKSRQVISDHDDDGDNVGMLSSSNADHFTENNQHDESFQNSESTIFNIEINRIDDYENKNEIDKYDENDISNNRDAKHMKKNRSSNTNKNKMNVIEDNMTINCAAVDSIKQLIASKRENVKQFGVDEESLNLEVTNMSIDDCSRVISVADESVVDVTSTIMPLPLSVSVSGSHLKQSHSVPPYVPHTNPIPHPAYFSSSLPFSPLPSSSFSSSIPALTPVPVPPTLAVILTETKASANALRHTLSNVSTCSTYTPVFIQSVHLNSSATATASSSSSSSSPNHHPLQQSVHLNGYTRSTVKDEVSVDMMDCMGRLKNVLEASDVTQLQLEIISIREENVLLKKLRDASVVDRMSHQSHTNALHFELTGTYLLTYYSVFQFDWLLRLFLFFS